jgi:membrane-bound lytic murein transglycosylase B
MTLNLKTTLLASTALAGVLNLAQMAGSYQAQVSFAAEQASNTSTPKAAPAKVARATAAATPAPTPVPTPVPAPPNPVVAAQTKLAAAGLSPTFAANYLDVQAKTNVPWQILAAVHKIETGQSGDTARKSYAGATGPMQFMPATFAHYALDGDANGTKDITDLDDALLTAGRYLAAGGADKGNYRTALYNYNHSNTYVNNVLGIAGRLGL